MMIHDNEYEPDNDYYDDDIHDSIDNYDDGSF